MGENAITELFGLIRDLKADVAAQTAILERVEVELKDKDARIRSLELENAKRKGIMTVVAAIGGVVGTIVAWIFKHLIGGAP